MDYSMKYPYRKLPFSISCLSMFMLGLFTICSGCNDSTGTDPTAPILDVDTTTIYFGTSLTEKSFSITNANTGESVKKLDWMVSVDDRFTWCTVTPDAGAGDATVTVTVDRKGLSGGEHLTSLVVRSNGGNITIKVYVVVDK